MQGGVIGKPNEPTSGRASGVWTVAEVFRARATGTWPIVLDPEVFAVILDLEAGNIGAAHFGGVLVGVIDTTVGNIEASDQWQTGERYALIAARQAMSPSSNLAWKTSNTATHGDSLMRTRWNGLGATRSLIENPNETLSNYPTYEYVDAINNNSWTGGFRGSPGDTSPSRPDLIAAGLASEWYLPALDELGLAFWQFKPVDSSNELSTRSANFPDGSFPSWGNPSSDPTRPAHTSSVPAQTDDADFQAGGDEAFDNQPAGGAFSGVYWTSTEASSSFAWLQFFGAPVAGRQVANSNEQAIVRARLFRRVLIP